MTPPSRSSTLTNRVVRKTPSQLPTYLSVTPYRLVTPCMSTDSSQLPKRLDPSRHLPTPRSEDIPQDAVQFAEDILNAAHPGSGFCGARRSVLAGSALYCAVVGLHGPIVTQARVGELCGTTPVSIRDWMDEMSRVAVECVDVDAFTGTDGTVVEARLQHLAAGGAVPDLPGCDDE